ncbi:hypothetical protein CJF32_00000196 [Rutstroemia sp. NJR-2017a WRK4]|nr:hypothetical protein CJF32_00000196 [Rutstroemia sp. NJR-2017a WRK4]
MEPSTPLMQNIKEESCPLHLDGLHSQVCPSAPLITFRPEFVGSFVTEWLESVNTPISKRSNSGFNTHRCRSDILRRSENQTSRGRPTKSEPDMSYRIDADGFRVPSGSAPSAPSASSAKSRLVSLSNYRSLNLYVNRIHVRKAFEEFPEHISNLIHKARRDRESPGPSLDQIRLDADLQRMEEEIVAESTIQFYFMSKVFPGTDGYVQRFDNININRHCVPEINPQCKLSTPNPDMIYGYPTAAFNQQLAQLISFSDMLNTGASNVILPFFATEFKSCDGTSPGSLWVASNQCVGDSVACVNLLERVNDRLKLINDEHVQLLETAAFSIAMSGTEARLYVTWKQDDSYYMQKVRGFLLQDPEHYQLFYKYVHNIVDWGRGERLDDIRKAFDCLQEFDRAQASREAKARTPPSPETTSSQRLREEE